MSCKAKVISVSDDDITYYTIPGSGGGLSQEGETIDDTVLGQCFSSMQMGLINWTIDSNAYYKGFAGYKANILKGGTPVASTGEAMTAVTVGSIYQVADSTKRVITETYVLYDGVTDITAEISKIDLLSGTVYLNSTYTVVGVITMDIEYRTLTSIGKAKGFELTQSSAVVDNTDLNTTHSNSGHRTFQSGLKEAGLSVSGIYDTTNGFIEALKAREVIILDLLTNDGTEESFARGYYYLTSDAMAGDVGDLETEDINFVLSVPIVEPKLLSPFKWYHPDDSTIPTAVKLIITAWEDNTELYVKYQPFGNEIGETSYNGKIVVSDTSLSADLDSMNEFSLSLQGTDELTPVVIS